MTLATFNPNSLKSGWQAEYKSLNGVILIFIDKLCIFDDYSFVNTEIMRVSLTPHWEKFIKEKLEGDDMKMPMKFWGKHCDC